MTIYIYIYICVYIYTYIHIHTLQYAQSLPTNNLPAKIAWLEHSGKFPMGLKIPPLKFKILHEANPLKSKIYGGWPYNSIKRVSRAEGATRAADARHLDKVNSKRTTANI